MHSLCLHLFCISTTLRCRHPLPMPAWWDLLGSTSRNLHLLGVLLFAWPPLQMRASAAGQCLHCCMALPHARILSCRPTLQVHPKRDLVPINAKGQPHQPSLLYKLQTQVCCADFPSDTYAGMPDHSEIRNRGCPREKSAGGKKETQNFVRHHVQGQLALEV